MPDSINQFQHVLRRLLRSPMFTAITLVTLGIGIGANTAIFSVINGILLKPLPYPSAEKLVAVLQTAPGIGIKRLEASAPDYFVFREENQTFEKFGLWEGDSVSVTAIAEPEQVQALDVTEDTLAVLGVRPLLGRGFTEKDVAPGSPETAILIHAYWQRRFGGDASVIGRRIIVDGRAREVIGVMPEDFRFLDRKLDLILPFQFNRAKTFLGSFSYQAIARLKPSVTLAQANADIGRMIPLVLTKFPPPPGFSVKMFSDMRIGPDVRPLKDDLVGDVGRALWVLMGTIGIVLLIACANVANLLLVRAEGRQHEFAIRAALGAGWARIARELLIESLMLGIAGGLLGLAIAYWALRLLVVISPARLPRLDNISIDPAVLLFSLAVSLCAGLLFGAIPAVKYAGPQVADALRGQGRTASLSRERHHARNTLVVVQVALALVLMIGAGLMIRTFAALKQVRPGFTRGEEIQTLNVFIPQAQVRDAGKVVRMQNDILSKMAEIQGVSSAAFASSVPTDGYNSIAPVYAEDRTYREGQMPLRRFKFVTPGFFRTLGNPLIAGRDLTWSDIYDRRPVALISENMAREMWRNPAAAIGKRIQEGHKAPWREIVGVVGDMRDDGAHQKAPSIVYWPMLMNDFWGNHDFVQRRAVYAIRSPRVGSKEFLKEVQQAVWAVNPNLPLARVRTLDEVYSGSLARTSFTLVMLAIAGAMALLLGIIGIYGAISYSVSQRTREIGIRMALGAQTGELKRMFVRDGLLLAGVGVAGGLAAALALTQLMSSLLFEVRPVDPMTYAAVSASLVSAALAASYLPARKTAAVAPAEALRAE